MKRYPKYKDSGVPWLGQVPAHWEVKGLKFLLSANQGGAWGDEPSGFGDTIVLRSTEQTQTGEWRIEDPELRSLSETERKKTVLKKGDILVTKASGSEAHIGKASLVDDAVASLNAGYSNFMQRLRARPGIEPQLILFMLNSKAVRDQFVYLSNSTSGLGNISASILNNVLVAEPPESEQYGIVDYIAKECRAIDYAINKVERMIELLKERRSIIITQAVTKGLDPKAKMKDSGVPWLGAVNKLWKYLPLKQVVSRPIQNGLGESSSRSDENDPRYIRITDIGSDGKLRDDTFSSVPLEDCKEAFVVRGDVLCAAVGGTVGKSYLHQLEGAFCYAGYLVRIRPEASKATPRFVKYWTESKNYWSQIEANLVKVTIENFSASRYSRTYMPLPTVEEQNAITDYLDDAIAKLDATIASQGQMIELLKERRSAIVTQAVTGQLDVR